jgi:phage tail-like protein
MAASDRKDPLTAFNFIVNIPGIGLIGFSEIGGLSGETDIVEYRNGDEPPRMRKVPGKWKHPQLNLKRGYTPNAKELWAWRLSVIQGKTKRYNGTITLRDEAAKPALVWHFFEAWPSKWAGPALNAKNNDVAIEEMELAVEDLALE